MTSETVAVKEYAWVEWCGCYRCNRVRLCVHLTTSEPNPFCAACLHELACEVSARAEASIAKETP